VVSTTVRPSARASLPSKASTVARAVGGVSKPASRPQGAPAA
jgi:hypothetical protein